MHGTDEWRGRKSDRVIKNGEGSSRVSQSEYHGQCNDGSDAASKTAQQKGARRLGDKRLKSESESVSEKRESESENEGEREGESERER
eukprot:4425253-Pleurochrysis_carterae.AAC.2